MDKPIVLATSDELQGFAGGLPPSELADAIRIVVSYLSGHPEVPTESCIEATRSIVRELRAGGLECVILEGEVLLERNSWLQHRVAIVETAERWAIVDLAARQVPRFGDRELMVVVLPPSPAVLRDALETLYAWAT